MDEQKIYRAALAAWGADAQTLMVFEEMSELQKELCKARQRKGQHRTDRRRNCRRGNHAGTNEGASQVRGSCSGVPAKQTAAAGGAVRRGRGAVGRSGRP